LKQTRSSLSARATILRDRLGPDLVTGNTDNVQELCQRLGGATQTRITVIALDGVVIGDSKEDPALMDNHASRPEIQEAFAGVVSSSIRYSRTLQQSMMYVAIPVLAEGRPVAVIRTSVSLAAISGTLHAVYLQIFLAGLVLALLAAAISYLVARRISNPLRRLQEGAERFAAGDLDHRLPVPNSEEIGALAESMNQMASQLSDRIRAVEEQRSKLETILASMVEGVLVVDSDANILSLNQAASELLGIAGVDMQGKSITEAIRNPGLQQTIQDALTGNEAVETEITVYGDPERFLQVHASGLGDTDGVRVGALIVLNDVSNLRRLEQLRRDFVANVSHELKTPITSIKGFVETLLNGAQDDPADRERFLNIVSAQADRLGAIVGDLLTLSRIELEAEKREISLQDGLLEPVLVGAADACAEKAKAKGMTIDISSASDLRASFARVLLEQALVNLIDNAINYSESGARVEVSGTRSENWVEIAVRDQGCGIAAEHLPRLFERFYRVDKARSRKLGGTGLGLAIVKHIAQAHRGEVGVESELGVGSTFTIKLPLPHS
jgi:two-component system phosphate regulon sensor histidine kinase PhoR